jgi:two-component system chemotaxis response regulator CheB
MVVAPGDRAKLVVSGGYPPNRPSADILLSTMGVALGERAIAVVLSGGGRDGATGATVVHGCGGTVIAADPESTPHSSMPNEAIERDQAVDHILDPPAIAELLIELTAV